MTAAAVTGGRPKAGISKMEIGIAESAYITRERAVYNGRAGSEFLVPDNAVRKAYNRNGVPEFDGRRNRISFADSILDRLPREVYWKIEPFVKRISLSKEQYLFQQDDDIESVYFPESAVVSEFQMLEDGRTIEVAVTGSEGAVGISSVLSAHPAVNCAQVCVAGTALKIESRILESELMSNRQLRRWLNDQINAYIRQISQKVICNTHHTVEERFCSWLLMLQDRSKRDKFNLTHEYIAGVLGVHRPSVTCIAKTLRERKSIDYMRGKIFISDRAKLKRICCACYSEPAAIRSPERRAV